MELSVSPFQGGMTKVVKPAFRTFERHLPNGKGLSSGEKIALFKIFLKVTSEISLEKEMSRRRKDRKQRRKWVKSTLI